jgi:hypothetical protein
MRTKLHLLSPHIFKFQILEVVIFLNYFSRHLRHFLYEPRKCGDVLERKDKKEKNRERQNRKTRRGGRGSIWGKQKNSKIT